MVTRRPGLYGLFWTDPDTGELLWILERSKKRSIIYAKRLKGYVHRMDLPESNQRWDAPTFRALSELIADFREKESCPPNESSSPLKKNV